MKILAKYLSFKDRTPLNTEYFCVQSINLYSDIYSDDVTGEKCGGVFKINLESSKPAISALTCIYL
jgi:hypothetical protein